MIVDCYTADIYCDCCKKWERDHPHGPGPHPEQFTGRNRREVMRDARKEGWMFRKKKCRCKKCSEEGRSFPKEQA